jgi:hypothetical protein
MEEKKRVAGAEEARLEGTVHTWNCPSTKHGGSVNLVA